MAAPLSTLIRHRLAATGRSA